MNAKKRYALVLISVAFLAFCYYGGHRLKGRKATRWKATLNTFSALENSKLLAGETGYTKENLLSGVSVKKTFLFVSYAREK